MFDKYKANAMTSNCMEKYAELKYLLNKIDKKESFNESDLELNSLLNVFIEPTNRCNLSCVFCARENMKRDYDMLSLDSFKRIIDGMPKGTYITMNGNGEPTINKDFYAMVSYAVEKGMIVAVNTNACLLNEENRKKLIHSGISRIQISFQSMNKEIDESIMRGKDFDKTLKNVLYLIYEIRKKQFPIFISIATVKTEAIKPYAELTKKFWLDMPIDNYYEGELLSLQSDSGMYTEVFEEYKPCGIPWSTVKINANGDVIPCICDFTGKFVIGNANEKTLMEILNSENAKKFRIALLKGNIEFLNEIGYNCSKCNTWTKQVGRSIEAYIESYLPLLLDIRVNEIAGDRPCDISNIKRAIDLLDAGEKNLLEAYNREGQYK